MKIIFTTRILCSALLMLIVISCSLPVSSKDRTVAPFLAPGTEFYGIKYVKFNIQDNKLRIELENKVNKPRKVIFKVFSSSKDNVVDITGFEKPYEVAFEKAEIKAIDFIIKNSKFHHPVIEIVNYLEVISTGE